MKNNRQFCSVFGQLNLTLHLKYFQVLLQVTVHIVWSKHYLIYATIMCSKPLMFYFPMGFHEKNHSQVQSLSPLQRSINLWCWKVRYPAQTHYSVSLFNTYGWPSLREWSFCSTLLGMRFGHLVTLVMGKESIYWVVEWQWVRHFVILLGLVPGERHRYQLSIPILATTTHLTQ
jgi:hypothetical protein